MFFEQILSEILFNSLLIIIIEIKMKVYILTNDVLSMCTF